VLLCFDVWLCSKWLLPVMFYRATRLPLNNKIIFFECCDSYNSSFCSFASKKARIHKVTLATHHPIPCKKPITKTTSNQSFITQPLNVVKANNKNMLFILYTISTKPQTPPKQNYKITTQTYNFRNLLCNSA